MEDVGKTEPSKPSSMDLLKGEIAGLRTEITILGDHMAKLKNGIIEQPDCKECIGKEESVKYNNVLDSMKSDIRNLKERISYEITNIKDLQEILL